MSSSVELSELTKKRFAGDLKLLKKDPLEFIDAVPSDNLLIWHFLIRGQPKSDYENGWYIGEIQFPKEYPDKPPNFKLLTPNGRFTKDKSICMTNTGFHTESWSYLWNIHAILMGFYSIMLEDKDTGLAHIKSTKDDRKKYADNSVNYNMENHKDVFLKFTRFINEDGTPKTDEELNSEIEQIRAKQVAKEKAKQEKKEKEKKEKKEKAKQEKKEKKEQKTKHNKLNEDEDDIIFLSKNISNDKN